MHEVTQSVLAHETCTIYAYFKLWTVLAWSRVQSHTQNFGRYYGTGLLMISCI